MAGVVTIGAIALGGYVAPLALLAALVLPGALVARVLGRAIRISLAVSAPVLISVFLVSLFTRAGSTVLFEVGPFEATLEGADFAARVAVRLVVMAMALTLFGLTTRPRELLADLERRGVGPRLTFAVAAALEAIPALLERARRVIAAQRARGLDTEGSVGARLRGVGPLVGPLILSSLHQVEERSLALAARGFGRPGRRELLWAPSDSAGQGHARRLLVAGLLAALVARATGLLAGMP